MADLPEDGAIIADGDYDFDLVGPLTDLNVTGGFAGGTIKIQSLNSNTGDPGDAKNGSFAAPFTTVIEGDNTQKARLNLTGSTNPTINAKIGKISR